MEQLFLAERINLAFRFKMPSNHRTIFYSWQSDVPAELNRTFIESALQEAITRLHSDAELESALRDEKLLLDRDTSGVPGSPPITQTILEKIEKSSAFVADLTFVGRSLPKLGRKPSSVRLFPNPNVLIEYGYALKCHTPKAIIAVINTAFGDRHLDKLPFDLRHLLGPIMYQLDDSEASKANAVFENLVADLTEKLKLIVAHRGSSQVDLAQRFSPAVPSKTEPSVFFDDAESLIPERPFNQGPIKPDIPNEGRAFLRLYPMYQVAPIKTALHALEIANKGDLRPMGLVNGWDRCRNKWGAITYAGPIGDKLYNFTQLFKSGEIWGIDAHALNATYCREWTSGQSGGFIASSFVERQFALSLANYLKFARDFLQLPSPLVVCAGMTGIKGYPLAAKNGRLGSVLDESIIWEGEVSDQTARADEVLKPFFEKMWEECGVKRPVSRESELLNEMANES